MLDALSTTEVPLVDKLAIEGIEIEDSIRRQMRSYSHPLRRSRFRFVSGLFLLTLVAPARTHAQAGSIVRRPTVGVAFEGGGALGLGHVGVLEWLEKNHVPVDYVAGTSMGGLVGGLYAIGNSPTEIRQLMRDIDWNGVLGGRIPFQDLLYRRKEDQRAYPNGIEPGREWAQAARRAELG